MEFNQELINKIYSRISLFKLEIKSISPKSLNSARILSMYRSKLVKYSVHAYGDVNKSFIQEELQNTIHKIELEANSLPTGTIELFSAIIEIEIAGIIFENDSQLKIFDGNNVDKGKRALLKSIYFLNSEEFGNQKEKIINELKEYTQVDDKSYFNRKVLLSTFLLLGLFSIIIIMLIL